VKLVAYAVLVLWKWAQRKKQLLQALDGAEWWSRLKVNKAKPKEDRGSSLVMVAETTL